VSDSFNVEVVLPSGKSRRINELNNKQYLVIIKFCENKDFFGLSEYFNTIFLDDDLDIIDRFYLLVYARMIFIEENLTFTTKEQRNVDVSLNIVLEKLESISYSIFDKTINYDNIDIKLGIPTALYFKDIDDLYTNIIKEIIFDKEAIDFVSLNTEERSSILNKLPVKLFEGLQQYLMDLSSKAFNITLIGENKRLNIQEIKLNLISNGVIEFVSAIFSIDLRSYYDLMYAFYNKILNGSDIFSTMSPMETKIMLNIHNKHIKSQNEELKKQQQ
tara:strand:- start:1756 stop:2577 length:822 start_codon:yes stop_codon:yes gene_type:complete